MCGHVGIAGKLEYKDEATLKRLLIYDFFRGPDSTGFAALKNNGEVNIVKIASHPIDLFDMKKFSDILSGYQSRVFLGHNRLATKGKVNGVNAHPYEFGHIIGAHNGTLDRSSWTKLEDLLGERFDVDSQAIFAAIAKLGIEETVPHLQGAWALVWINLEDNTLNFLRNKERPFWYAYDKEFNKVFWASEWPMIDAATKTSSNPYELYKSEEGYRFWSTDVDWWYKYDLDALASGSIKDRPKPHVKKLKGKEPAPAASYACGVDPFNRHVGGQTTTTVWKNGQKMATSTTAYGTSTGSSTTGSHSTGRKQPKDVTVLELDGSESRPAAGVLSASELQDLADVGCAWCGSEIDIKKPGYTVYNHERIMTCSDCNGNPGSVRIYLDTIEESQVKQAFA